MLLELGAGHRGADAPAAPVLGDRASLGDALDVDDQRRLDDIGAHLHEEVGASGQDARLARALGEQRRRPLHGLRCLVSHQRLVLSRVSRSSTTRIMATVWPPVNASPNTRCREPSDPRSEPSWCSDPAAGAGTQCVPSSVRRDRWDEATNRGAPALSFRGSRSRPVGHGRDAQPASRGSDGPGIGSAAP